MTTEWQPIETAPRDGTRIWLAKEKHVFVGWWSGDDTKFPWAFLEDSGDPLNAYMGGKHGPQHWMPFTTPEAP